MRVGGKVDARRPDWLRWFARMRASHGDLTRESLVPIRGRHVWRDPLLLQSSKERVPLIRTHGVPGQLRCEALDEYKKVCVVDHLVPVSRVGGGC